MFADIEEFKRANEGSGNYWFSPDTMLFFDSKVESDLVTIGERQFFITSEQLHYSDGTSEPRLFTIREAKADASVDTVGKFQGYHSRQAAESDIEFALAVTS